MSTSDHRRPFFGKYRGKVVGNVDPLQLGRLQLQVPAVLGNEVLGWAMPCVPYAGADAGLFLLPQIGTNVWVEFEGGDPEHPIWTGCFWGNGDVPASPAVPDKKVLRTSGVTVTIDDLQGSVEVETSGGMKLTLGPVSIELSNGRGATIAMSDGQVSINDGGLEVD